jgi:hypothetical protein
MQAQLVDCYLLIGRGEIPIASYSNHLLLFPYTKQILISDKIRSVNSASRAADPITMAQFSYSGLPFDSDGLEASLLQILSVLLINKERLYTLRVSVYCSWFYLYISFSECELIGIKSPRKGIWMRLDPALQGLG